jgi:hypothetical protein
MSAAWSGDAPASGAVQDEAAVLAVAAALRALAQAMASLAASFGGAVGSPAKISRQAIMDAAELTRCVRSLREVVEQATFARQSAPMPPAFPTATQLAHRRTA